MRRTIFSTIGLLFIALFVSACFFLAGPEGEVKVLQQSPLPTASGPTPLPTPEFCISTTHDCVVLEFLGYETGGDGTTTLINYRITNNCADEVAYFAIETGFWTRDTPTNGSSYSGSLGSHAVTWVDDQQGIPTQGLRFDSQATGFKEGAAELYTFTVRDFTPRSPNTGRVVVGDRELAFRMMLLDPACEIGVNPTPRPTPTDPFSPLPTPTPIPLGYILPTEPVVPQCVFGPPAGGLPPDEPVIPLSAYSFSEPTLVLTHTAPIGIEQWLPDSETLMITRRESMDVHYYSVDLINTSTGENYEIIEPRLQLKDPKWLSLEQTMVWRETSSPVDSQPGYWIRSLEPSGQRRISDNATGASIAHDVSPSGDELAFMSLPGGTQPLILDQETKTLRVLPVDLADWRYQKGPSYPLHPFNINWQPNDDRILFWDGTWVFLYDLNTNGGCEINMQTYTGQFDSFARASWSPNGRYLSAQLTLDPPYTTLNGPYDLIWVLDTYTGDDVKYNVGIDIHDFDWAPNNQIIAISGPTGQKSGDFDQHGIYLLNIHNGEFQRIPAEENFSINKPKWTSDGERMAFYCHDYSGSFNFDDYRICISSVSISQ